MIRKYHNHTLQTNPRHVTKSHRAITNTRHKHQATTDLKSDFLNFNRGSTYAEPFTKFILLTFKMCGIHIKYMINNVCEFIIELLSKKLLQVVFHKKVNIIFLC